MHCSRCSCKKPLNKNTSDTLPCPVLQDRAGQDRKVGPVDISGGFITNNLVESHHTQHGRDKEILHLLLFGKADMLQKPYSPSFSSQTVLFSFIT